MSTSLERSALCAALAKINAVHVDFCSEHQGLDAAPFHQLLNKVLSFLQGELKSEANLLRFHEAFCQWRDALEENDTLAFGILELCASALHSALDCLFDPECDDMALIEGSLSALWDEYDELGGQSQELRTYWLELRAELLATMAGKSQRPLPKAYFALLKDTNVSLFGLEA